MRGTELKSVYDLFLVLEVGIWFLFFLAWVMYVVYVCRTVDTQSEPKTEKDKQNEQ